MDSLLNIRTPATEASAWPERSKAWYAVGVLVAVYTVNFIDRGIVTLLIGAIKRDMRLTDTQVSLLVGFAFACLYLVLGLPLARLVDTRSRRATIGIGVALWSLATVMCGLANSFTTFFIARMAVGIGEACVFPAIYSLLSDLFPRERLVRAISVLNFGFVAGNGLAALTGAAAIQAGETLHAFTLPFIGELRPWQLTFLLIGAPGLLVALLSMTLIEPPRRGRLTTLHGRAGVPVREVIAFMWERRTTYLPLFIGPALMSLLSVGVATWTPEMFVRTYGWSVPRYSIATGIVFVIAFPIGLMAGGLLAEKLAARGHDDANLRVTVLAVLGYVPAAVLFPLMPTPALALTMLAVTFACISLAFGPQNAALQVVTPNQMRGQVTALSFFMLNVVGLGFGATLVALATDHLFGNEAQLRYSIATVSAVLGPFAAAVLSLGLKPYGKSVARAREWA